MKGTSGTHRETEASGIKVCRGHCPFSKPSTHKARKLVPYLRLHTRTTLFYPTWRSPETLPHPTYRSIQAAFPYEWLVLAPASQLPKSSQTTAGPRPGTSSSQPRFTIWLCLGISKPSRSSSHLRLLYGSCRVAPSRTQVGADLGLYHLGNPRTGTPSEQLYTTLECQHPTTAQLILHRGWRLMVSGHSQSLHLTGLGKSLPLICQQQPRFNYKRCTHTKGTP